VLCGGPYNRYYIIILHGLYTFKIYYYLLIIVEQSFSTVYANTLYIQQITQLWVLTLMEFLFFEKSLLYFISIVKYVSTDKSNLKYYLSRNIWKKNILLFIMND